MKSRKKEKRYERIYILGTGLGGEVEEFDPLISSRSYQRRRISFTRMLSTKKKTYMQIVKVKRKEQITNSILKAMTITNFNVNATLEMDTLARSIRAEDEKKNFFFLKFRFY